MKKITVLFIAMVAVLAAGCGTDKSGASEPDETVRLVASEPTLPSDFEQMSVAQKTRGFLAVSVNEQDAFETAWTDYGMEDGRPELDFKEEAAIFISLQESSSCPNRPESFDTTAESGELGVHFEPLPDVCTADLAPRTLVISVKKEIAGDLKTIRLYLQQQEVSVPLLGLQVEY
ncbi:hypothetical protein NCCP2716_11840 [Sporosarcina sp. NCCP-2716]|uniref:hypothetical protein n=1 Tax=Sporosarcina sp. NCCP-2716 TaxID=2943679 RepID=UPI00203E23E9|nr:hypothetical protein [Sporosarcina sp. NCCP-2716]GKV68686.1 hypothetical protein NCCP2716_11840 [Sporosarcina sp. NCCP-2716]